MDGRRKRALQVFLAEDALRASGAAFSAAMAAFQGAVIAATAQYGLHLCQKMLRAA